MLPGWQRWMKLDRTCCFTHRMLPGWQRWMKLDRTCFCTPDVTRLAAMDEARSHMLLHTGRYQVGSGSDPRSADSSNGGAPCQSNPMQRRVLLHTAYCGTHPNVAQRRAHEGACHLKQAYTEKTALVARSPFPDSRTPSPQLGSLILLSCRDLCFEFPS